MSPTLLAPIDKHERVFSLDILRGFVLCGIVLMNITGFGLWARTTTQRLPAVLMGGTFDPGRSPRCFLKEQ